MDEYISKSRAKKILCHHCHEFIKCQYTDTRECGWIRLIDVEPVADVVPVRHGRWEWREEWNNSTTEHYAELESCGWYCSHCGIELGDYLTKRIGETIYLDDESRKPFLNRCPDCGWIMDLEDEDNG